MFGLDQNELTELETLKELCEDMYVDGKKVICFDVLSDVINRRKKLKDMSSEDLLRIYAELKGYKEFWNDVEWYNNDTFEKLLPKIKEVIKKNYILVVSKTGDF